MLESGCVSVKNEVNIMMKNIVDIVLGGCKLKSSRAMIDDNFHFILYSSYILALWLWDVVWTRAFNEPFHRNRRLYVRFDSQHS